MSTSYSTVPLSAFVEDAVRRSVEFRQAQQRLH